MSVQARIRRWLWRLFLIPLGGMLLYQSWIFGHVVYWNTHDPATSAFMRNRLEEARENGSQARLHLQWIPYERISSHLKRAVVAAEDDRFMMHEGFDYDAMRRAHERNLKAGRLVAGGSTISQQLAKNLFLSASRTPWRKAQEAVITLMLEGVMSKRRILEIYLNVIEWGDGVFGAEAAMRHYYGISADSAGMEQAARLAAMIPDPRYHDRHRDTAGLKRKMRAILARMAAARIP
ncbi:monofunctional biosynthetic peptidoglycan transglycosylase [Nitrosovibrio sp. Nv17]|nr:monofunctional biosynthetic peptidoglycan transglycosylase [Nitrosovibrio sp. Nv17]